MCVFIWTYQGRRTSWQGKALDCGNHPWAYYGQLRVELSETQQTCHSLLMWYAHCRTVYWFRLGIAANKHIFPGEVATLRNGIKSDAETLAATHECKRQGLDTLLSGTEKRNSIAWPARRRSHEIMNRICSFIAKRQERRGWPLQKQSRIWNFGANQWCNLKGCQHHVHRAHGRQFWSWNLKHSQKSRPKPSSPCEFFETCQDSVNLLGEQVEAHSPPDMLSWTRGRKVSSELSTGFLQNVSRLCNLHHRQQGRYRRFLWCGRHEDWRGLLWQGLQVYDPETASCGLLTQNWSSPSLFRAYSGGYGSCNEWHARDRCGLRCANKSTGAERAVKMLRKVRRKSQLTMPTSRVDESSGKVLWQDVIFVSGIRSSISLLRFKNELSTLKMPAAQVFGVRVRNKALIKRRKSNMRQHSEAKAWSSPYCEALWTLWGLTWPCTLNVFVECLVRTRDICTWPLTQSWVVLWSLTHFPFTYWCGAMWLHQYGCLNKFHNCSVYTGTLFHCYGMPIHPLWILST